VYLFINREERDRGEGNSANTNNLQYFLKYILFYLYMPADGAFCYVLKRLSDAERDNDKIYGIIRGVHVSTAGPAEGRTV
jgi:hypothetical protein